MTVVEKITSYIEEGKTPSEIEEIEGITRSSLERYIRWARKFGLLPKRLRIEEDEFVVEGRKAKSVLAHDRVKTAVIFNDLHCPFQDWKAIDVMCQIIEAVRPDHLYENGDGLDAWPFSKFAKDPAKRHSWQYERETHRRVIKAILDAAPEEAKYVYVGGEEDNHFNRWMQLLWEHDLADMPELSKASILYMDELGGEYVDDQLIINGTFRIAHGTRYGVNAPKLTLHDHMISGIQGHSHRLGTWYRTTASGEYVYAANGHLTDVTKAYKRHPDWQQGFSVVYFLPDGRFSLYQVPIVKHKAVWNGRLFKA